MSFFSFSKAISHFCSVFRGHLQVRGHTSSSSDSLSRRRGDVNDQMLPGVWIRQDVQQTLHLTQVLLPVCEHGHQNIYETFFFF